MLQLFKWKQELSSCLWTSTIDVWLCVKTDAFMWFNEKAIAIASSINFWYVLTACHSVDCAKTVGSMGYLLWCLQHLKTLF